MILLDSLFLPSLAPSLCCSDHRLHVKRIQEDPVVHFHETFLAAYDPALRETRGVHYTPEPNGAVL